jgi:hypothetical protein
MTIVSQKMLQFNYARLSGIAYLGVIVFGIYAELFVRTRLIVPEDPVATISNIQASELLFRSAFISDLFMLASYVFLGYALYMLVCPVRKNLALVFAFFHVVGAAIMGMNMLNPFAVQVILENAGYTAAFGEDQLQAQVTFFLDMNKQGYLAAQMMFAPWAVILGYMILLSGYIPRFFGVIYMIGGIGYLIDCLVAILLPEYLATITTFAILPMVVAEFGICLWFLFLGGKVHQGYLKQVQLNG